MMNLGVRACRIDRMFCAMLTETIEMTDSADIREDERWN